MIYINPADSVSFRNVKIPVFVKCGIGIGRGSACKTVCHGIELVVRDFVVKRILSVYAIKTDRGKHPQISRVIRKNIKVVVVREGIHIYYPSVLHVLKGVRGYDPV